MIYRHGRINMHVKIDFRFKLHDETEMKKLFESRKVVTGAATVDPDTKIIFTKVYYWIKILDNT